MGVELDLSYKGQNTGLKVFGSRILKDTLRCKMEK